MLNATAELRMSPTATNLTRKNWRPISPRMSRALKARWKCASLRAVSPTPPISLSRPRKNTSCAANPPASFCHPPMRSTANIRLSPRWAKSAFPCRALIVCAKTKAWSALFFTLWTWSRAAFCGTRACRIFRAKDAAPFSRRKFRRWQNCTMPITRRSGWATLASREIIFPARFRAGRSSIKYLKPRPSAR